MDYLDYFKQYPDMYAKVVANFDRVHTLADFLLKSGVLDGAETVLSIGPGDGPVEVRLAKERGFQLGLVEPSASLFKQLETNLAAAEIEDRVIEVINKPFEDYEPAQNYDVVLSLFSWFAFGFDRAVLEKALGCAKPGGKLLICIQDEASPSTRISAISRSGGINLTSEKLSQWALGEGFDHELITYHGHVSADIYLEKDQLAQGGRDLTSFLLALPWE